MNKQRLSLEDISEIPIRGEIYSSEKLEEYALYLGEHLSVEGRPRRRTSLLKRMHDSNEKLIYYYRILNQAIRNREDISPAAEWLADNFHIVEEQVREIRQDLPKSYYEELPKITNGDLAGYPRIYALALAIIAHTDSRLDILTLRKFVDSFQVKAYLTMGELWGVAITLRLALVENMRRVSARVMWDRQQRKAADQVAEEIIEAAQKSPIHFNKKLQIIKHLCSNTVENQYAFISQLVKRLRDQEAEIWQASQCLEDCLKEHHFTIEQIVNLEHQHQAANQVTIANIITSMRLLSNLDWKNFVESVSLIDRVLEQDPSGHYRNMDFATRDSYRHTLERISKRTHTHEMDVAKKVLALANEKGGEPTDKNRRTHIGYYLQDEGLKNLEATFKYRPFLKEALFRNFKKYATSSYFGFLGLIVFILVLGPLYYANNLQFSKIQFVILGLFLAIPVSDLGLSILNFFYTHLVLPRPLAKMSMSRGVPESCRTLVVIPCLLFDEKTILELLERLEIHYLGNVDKQIYFALLTDYVDASTPTTDQDHILLQIAKTGIQHLNEKYLEGSYKPFGLFHRKRVWNPVEEIWMGWERKRGKIHELNRKLRVAQDTSFEFISMPESILKTFKYVITVDADTQLTRDSAQKLIGTISHPLNAPFFDVKLGRVTKGYGIIQPRISISLESSSKSIFAQIFSGHTGMDPYTTAISDVYQDIFGEGSYTGKGLYDIDAFEASLQGRVPENKILSHDLFEGLFARTALVTDIEFLDDYPTNYISFFKRQHRWTRGDWQTAPWMMPFIPNASGKFVKNELPLISRWKIFDNLRRSLVAPSILIFLVFSWLALPGSVIIWCAFAFLALGFPCAAHVANSILLSPRGISWTSNFWGAFGRARINLAQMLLSMIFLGHQAYIQTDAICRVIYRTFISKKKLLEWTTAAQQEKEHALILKKISQGFLETELILFSIFVSLMAFGSLEAQVLGGTLLCFFAIFPLVAKGTRGRWPQQKKVLGLHDKELLADIARRVWLFFEHFVGPEDNWLPPDNFQEDPEPKIAHRTSPTNIGLYGLSIISAYDFGFLSARVGVERLNLLFATLKKMERFEGHLYNWYDTNSLQPLYPRYVSVVDSGNYAGYLLVIKQSVEDIVREPFLHVRFLKGLLTTLHIVEKELKDLVGSKHFTSSITIQHLLSHIEESKRFLVSSDPDNIFDWHVLLRFLRQSLDDVRDSLTALEYEHGPRHYQKIKRWADALHLQVRDLQVDVSLFAPYIEQTQFFVNDCSHKYGIEKNFADWAELLKLLSDIGPIQDIPRQMQKALSISDKIKNELINKNLGSPEKLCEWNILEENLHQAITAANLFLESAQSAARDSENFFKELNFKFLLDPDRQVFFVGYNVAETRFDNSYYDLLASEARLASFVAIAKGDVSQKHWFKMGRQLVPAEGRRALVSWSASMFEYFMPHLVMKNYENTLIDETLNTVIKRQIRHGKKMGVPWGVSEAGYNARDVNFNYQYGPFGIPGMGLKRGLAHDLVISPYSSFLAALYNPVAALKNIREFMRQKLLTDFGFYESIDYTPERLAEKSHYAVIKSFMAHHQGMTLVAINNVLNQSIMQKRFHSELRVRAAQLLLQERIPQKMPIYEPKAAEIEWNGVGDALTKSFTRIYEKTHHYSPRVQLLSNGKYSLVLSTAGAGYSKCESVAVTRWREDSSRDNWGSFIYLKDLTDNTTWSATYQPTVKNPDSYKVAFSEDRAEFWREDGPITTSMQVVVSPEDDVELRQVTVKNKSNQRREFEITSYCEPVLAPSEADAAHPAFSKLFLQTEYLESKNALLAHRRPRSEKNNEIWGFHSVVCESAYSSPIQYETDRARFIGRGRELFNPLALQQGVSLSKTVGSTLDPIFSLRVRVSVAPGKSCNIIFSTGVAHSRGKILQLTDRYHDKGSFDRESKLAWTKVRIDLRHLGLDSEEAYLFQRLAERIIFSDPTLRLPSYQLAKNIRGQSSLWPYGISGDLPIVAVVARDKKDLSLIKKILRAHEYLRMKGLIFDLVLLNDSRTSYMQDLQEDILRQVRLGGGQGFFNKMGGIFVLVMDQMKAEDQNLIQAMAKVLISSEWGSLKEQINRKIVQEKHLPTFSPCPLSMKTAPTKEALTIPKLDHFNGLGGFSKQGEEYVIVLQPGQWTPLPWINVIANKKEFGFQVSESGSGFTWAKNSRENRITPWSNDSVVDPCGEVIYLRDEDSGEIWTPTPLPIRQDSTYLIRHGQGYSVFEHASHNLLHSLIQFVPVEDPIKISRLRIKNLTNEKRRISVSAYVEWVLGHQREVSAPYIFTECDGAQGPLYAMNKYNQDFPQQISFLEMSGEFKNYTCDRKEFIGRNGNYAAPAALQREGLAKRKGLGLDPCGVLQSTVELAGFGECDIYILLGQVESLEQMRSLAEKYKNPEICTLALSAVKEQWQKILNTVQIKTPESIFNIMLNRWVLYQSLVCRFWARSAFYQSGGAYGFRDQLQDCMAFVYSAPDLVREHILKAAGRQFIEGDVQHWWHPPTGRGVRTRFSDDLLWLPFVVSHYVRVTQDKEILNEQVSFIKSAPLKPEQEDAYIIPQTTEETASLLEHCLRTFDRSLAVGEHGLPLIGCGDWNDGMNSVGEQGKGESVWLGWFLYKVLEEFIPLVPENNSYNEKIINYRMHIKKILTAIESQGWDGQWYRRAFYDDGTPLGSASSEECKIDSLAQTWSVLSGAGDSQRQQEAMNMVLKHLVKKDKNLILLLAPPFDKTPLNPGYIKGYVPGVRENGGEYVHAALWVVMAFAQLGEGNKALELLNMINPIQLTANRAGIQRYKIEPYVVAADIYAISPHEGRGGWSWYTGSASWFYRVGLESILGLRKEGDVLSFKPCVPPSWNSFEINYQYKTTQYQILVQNPHHLGKGQTTIVVEGEGERQRTLRLKDDGKTRKVIVTIGKEISDQPLGLRSTSVSL